MRQVVSAVLLAIGCLASAALAVGFVVGLAYLLPWLWPVLLIASMIGMFQVLREP